MAASMLPFHINRNCPDLPSRPCSCASASESAQGSDDDEGWREIGFRLTSSVRAILEALETGREPRTSGDNMRKGLEIGIALRESHRQEHAPVRLPLEDRSMKIVPHAGRMYSKKRAQGREEYMEQMAAYKRD